MVNERIESAKSFIEAMVVFAVMWFVYGILVQPILIAIDPVFANTFSTTTSRRGLPTNLSQIALYATGITGYFLYIAIKLRILGDGEASLLDIIHAMFLILIDSILPRRVANWLFD